MSAKVMSDSEKVHFLTEGIYRVSAVLFILVCVLFLRLLQEKNPGIKCHYYCGNFCEDLGWISRLSSWGAAFLCKHHYHHGNNLCLFYFHQFLVENTFLFFSPERLHDIILLNQLLNLLQESVYCIEGFRIYIQCQQRVPTCTPVKKSPRKAQGIKLISVVERGTWNLSMLGADPRFLRWWGTAKLLILEWKDFHRKLYKNKDAFQ